MTADAVPPQPPPLPGDLPRPTDDGAADHLPGTLLPDERFPSTHGDPARLRDLAANALVLYVFPAMGRPGQPDPEGWVQTPGAYGCTQQSCAFRDDEASFVALGYRVAGLSAQPTEEQQEAAARLHLPFSLLADPELRLARALGLPTFAAGGRQLYKRLTFVARKERVVKVFYPVFPPHENAREVLAWILSEDGA